MSINPIRLSKFNLSHEKRSSALVISKPTDSDYQDKLDVIEELDPTKTSGKVEFVFAVNQLSEGWDWQITAFLVVS